MGNLLNNLRDTIAQLATIELRRPENLFMHLQIFDLTLTLILKILRNIEKINDEEIPIFLFSFWRFDKTWFLLKIFLIFCEKKNKKILGCWPYMYLELYFYSS